MIKKYYITDIIGDGSEDNPYRSILEDIGGFNFICDIPSNKNGSPRFSRCIVLVSSDRHELLEGKAGITLLEDYYTNNRQKLNGKKSTVNYTGQISDKITDKQELTESTIDTIRTTSNTTEEFIEKVGKIYNKKFNLNSMYIR